MMGGINDPKWFHKWLRKHLRSGQNLVGGVGAENYVFIVNSEVWHNAEVIHSSGMYGSLVDIRIKVDNMFHLLVTYKTHMRMSLDDSQFINRELKLFNGTTEDEVEHLFMLSELMKT